MVFIFIFKSDGLSIWNVSVKNMNAMYLCEMLHESQKTWVWIAGLPLTSRVTLRLFIWLCLHISQMTLLQHWKLDCRLLQHIVEFARTDNEVQNVSCQEEGQFCIPELLWSSAWSPQCSSAFATILFYLVFVVFNFHLVCCIEFYNIVNSLHPMELFCTLSEEMGALRVS